MILLRKTILKTFSIPKKVANDFDDYCERKGYNKSAKVTIMIKEWLKKEGITNG